MPRYVRKEGGYKTKDTKYTIEFVSEELKGMLEKTKKDRDIVFIKQLFEDKDYTYERFSEWNREFDDEYISRTIKSIHGIIESRTYVGALNSGYNATIAIFGLKNNYGWKDKTEQEVTQKEVVTKEEMEKMTDEELNELNNG